MNKIMLSKVLLCLLFLACGRSEDVHLGPTIPQRLSPKEVVFPSEGGSMVYKLPHDYSFRAVICMYEDTAAYLQSKQMYMDKGESIRYTDSISGNTVCDYGECVFIQHPDYIFETYGPWFSFAPTHSKSAFQITVERNDSALRSILFLVEYEGTSDLLRLVQHAADDKESK